MELVTDVISKVLGVSKDKVKLEDNFYQLGGNSANAVAVVVNLRKAGFSKVKLPDILNAKTIGDLVCVVTGNPVQTEGKSYEDQAKERFQIYVIDDTSDRKAIIELVTDAYTINNKAVSIVASADVIRGHLEANYELLIGDKLSRYVLDTTTNRIVACNLTYDRSRQVTDSPGMDDLVEIIVAAEKSAEDIIEKEGGKWVESYITCTQPGLPAVDGAYLMTELEFLAADLAEKAGYDGLIACQMHPATVNLADILIESGFEEAGRMYIKNFIFSGDRDLYKDLPDDEISRMLVRRFKK